MSNAIVDHVPEERLGSASGSGEEIHYVYALQWLAVIFGAVLRVARYIHFRSLWMDEMYLADSVLFRGARNLLFTPLANQQAAPAGFLFLSRLSVVLVGQSEYTLRLLPLIAGLVSLPLFLAVSRRMLHPGAALLAIALFATLEPFIYYSSDFKPYSCDVAVALGIFLAMLRFLETPDRGRGLIAGAVGVLALSLSFPAVFILGGTSAAILWRCARSANRPALRNAFMMIALWIFAFVFQYALFVRPNIQPQTRANLVYYWNNQDAFMPMSPLRIIPWLLAKFWHLCQESDALSFAMPDLAFFAMLYGFYAAFRRCRMELAFLIAPLPLALAASMFKQYPFDGRLALFIAPSLLIFIAFGVQALFSESTGKIAAVTIAALFLWPSTTRAWDQLRHPQGREESLQTYQWVARNWQTGDTLYLSHFATESYTLYFKRTGWPADPNRDGDIHVQPEFDDDSRGIIDDVSLLRGRKRVWVILIHAAGGSPDKAQLTRTAFDDIGMRVPLMSHEEVGAEAVLYNCATPSPPARGR